VAPAPAQVDLPVGATLTLTVTSDHDDELHAHGFEVEQNIKAGMPTTITLTGKNPGVFEVELHEPALTLLTVAVR
jgi:heme/copper-type cytochrome/quinol oxidase subunit 2